MGSRRSFLRSWLVFAAWIIGRDSRAGADAGHYDVDIGTEAETRLLAKARTFPTGSSVAAVRSALGEPDEDHVLMAKESPRFISRDLHYYIRRKDRRFVNEKYDRYVVFEFDRQDRLTGAFHKSGEGLPTRL